MSFELEPKENHTCPLFSQILNEFSQSILCHAFTLLFPVTLHPHVRHYSAQALARIFWTPRMNSSSRTRPFAELTFRASETHFVLKITTFRAPAIYPKFTKYCACHEKWHSNITKCCACHAKWLSWLMSVTHDTSFTTRGATDLILQHHQMLRLPRQMTRIIYPRDIWNVIYNARRNRHHPPTSPNTAPATQNDSHDWSSSHMKRHLQCAAQQATPSNLNTAPATQKCTPKSKRNSPKTVETAFTMRGRFDHDPNMIRAWTRHLAPARSPRLLFALRRRILYWKLQHFALRLSIQISPNTVPATKSDTPTSPSAVPATQNDSHDWCASHMTRHLHCAEQQISSSNITKCCACHAKWLASSILVTYETLFTMRGGTGITRQPHQILRLPRKMTLMIDLRHIWNVIYNARSNRHHPPTSPNTAPATQKCTPNSKRNSPKTVETSFTMRGRFDHDPNMTRAWTRHHAFCIENYNISRSGYLSKFHQTLCLPRKVTLQHHQVLRLPRKVTLQDHQILPLPRKVALQDHQMLRLPRQVTLQDYIYCTVTSLLLLLHCYFITALLLYCYFYCTVTLLLLLLHCYFNCTVYCTVTLLLLLLHCYLNCYCTGLFAFLNLRNSEVSQLNFLW